MTYENLIGLTNTAEDFVTEKNTALALGSGSLNVFATPALIRLVEIAAAQLVEKNIPPESTSVGISLNIKHTAPTPLNMNVRAVVKVIAVDGRKIVFEVVAFDERGEIGRGSHERFIVYRKKFQAKADAKAQPLPLERL